MFGAFLLLYGMVAGFGFGAACVFWYVRRRPQHMNIFHHSQVGICIEPTPIPEDDAEKWKEGGG